MKMFAVFAAGALAAGMIGAGPAAAQPRGWTGSGDGYRDGYRDDRRGDYHGRGEYRGHDDRNGRRWERERRRWDRDHLRPAYGWRDRYRPHDGYRNSGYRGRPDVVCRIVGGYHGPERRCFDTNR